jgi:hypothetical protein
LASIHDFIRQQIVAIKAMEEFRRSVIGPVESALPKLATTGNVLENARIQAMMREALEKNRAVTCSLSSIAPWTMPAFRATEAITSIMESTRPFREQAATMARMQTRWKELLATSVASLSFPALQSHMASLARVAETSRMLATMLPMDRIGFAFTLPPELRTGLLSGFEELTGAYGDFYEGVGEVEDRVLTLPPVATARPASEYFNAVDLLETTTGEEVEGEAEEEIQAVRAQIAELNAAGLSDSLAGIFPNLVGMLKGARAAFTSRHADYQRHFITSLRELFTQVLHLLAPEDQVKEFSTDAKDFPNGKPTRNVRLRYICRGINDERFGKFVDKDVAAALALVDLFQGGTHAVTCSYTEQQLRALLVRAEGLVHFLLEIAVAE